MRRGFRLGSVRGVEVVADLSLFVIAALLTWSLYVDLDNAFPASSADTVLLAALVGGAFFLGSVFIHELSHSLVALRRGLSVRRIRLFIFGGVSEIEEEASSPGDELAVTVAGPAASFVLGVAFLLLGWALSGGWALPARISLILGLANLSIAIFNLLPGLPLDGGRVLRALVWSRSGDRARATRLAVATGRGLGVLVMVAGAALVVAVGDISALWLVAIGWFLFEAAATSGLQELFAKRIEGLTVGDVMRRTEMAIDGDSTVAEALELHGWGDKLRTMPVDVNGRVVGIFGTREIAKVQPTDRTSALVRDAMTAIGPEDLIGSDVTLRRALAQDAGGAGMLVVVDRGEVVGLLSGEEMRDVFDDLRRSR
ncbi:MAG: site-2 protease family protein [Acidimicrobiia bacterium]|nr:site-2 protease family protein [Acidimicrobiia bacterium]